MGEGNYDLLHPGWSLYHHRGLIVPILAPIFAFYIAKFPPFTWLERGHHVMAALALGVAVTAVSYVFLKYVPVTKDPSYALNKAVLLGLLCSEILIFTYPSDEDFSDRIVSAPVLAFFVFMYLFAVSEIYKEQ
jgi:hypothetical protein